ncbi:L-tyrosine/L-tryptophan isonitrile synthase family protein [Candidatus Daviesbacteria bacterium]|nr:L-tyrosine/L-tryptophan isonitrile synthase family protein [Candidatus Daviesbacteria bacterium]
MKANPYVYPFVPFKDLSDKSFRWKLGDPQTYSVDQLKDFLNHKISFPKAKIKGKTLVEKIFNIFLNKNILYGNPDDILVDKDLWLQRIRYFTSKNKPLQLTIHGFPFKIPCPLKSDRKLPDLGEVLSLYKLNSLLESIKSAYKPGAQVTIIGEGGFGKFVGISNKEWQNYRNFLKKLLKNLSLSNIKIVDIANLEKDKSFNKTFNKIKTKLEKLYKERNEAMVKKINGTIDSVFRIVSTRDLPIETVMDIYDEKNNDPKIVGLRREILDFALRSVFEYHAYLMTRDELDFVNKTAPHSLPLSVSPKRGRLGVYPIAAEVDRLPYHGVPVFNSKTKEISIEYLIDIKREAKKFTPVHLQGDKDPKPFFYII